MPELKIYRGLPASGKSTAAQEWVAEDPANRVRVNRDDIRFEILGEWYPTATKKETVKDKEARVTVVEHQRISDALAAKKDVVSDNTNLNPRLFKTYGDLAAKAGATISNRDFPISLEEAKRRNAARERKVPEFVIDNMARDYMGPKGEFHLFPGSYPVKPFAKPTTRKQAVIFDADGTLADVRGIRHFVRGKYKNFDMFHRSSLWSPPNQEVVDMAIAAHEAGLSVLVVTARTEMYRGVTQKWLDELDTPISYENIYMRPDGDMRKDILVKREILDKIREDYDIVHCVDDNIFVNFMWSEEGIQTTKVPGFTEEDIVLIGETTPIHITNPIVEGLCLRCGRPLKNGGVLGPECSKII
jgi:predicted kinase